MLRSGSWKSVSFYFRFQLGLYISLALFSFILIHLVFFLCTSTIELHAFKMIINILKSLKQQEQSNIHRNYKVIVQQRFFKDFGDYDFFSSKKYCC